MINPSEIFLEKHLEMAVKEVDCYFYQQKLANEAMKKWDFESALAYHQNMTRALNELRVLKSIKASESYGGQDNAVHGNR